MAKRNIYFYSLEVVKSEIVNGTQLKANLNKDETYEFMKNLYNDLPTNKNGYKYLKNEVGKQYFLIEFIDFDEKSTFVRLGKPNQNNEVGKRNVESCDLIDIPLERAELIETYTYLYINFETDVISYVRVGSAPTIKSFSASISSQENIRCSGYSVKCIPFITKEILDSFGSRAEVGSISITTKKPTTKITEYLGGIREDDIEELDSTEMTLQLSIKPKSRGGNTTSGKGLGKIFNKFKNADENLSKFVVNIADELKRKQLLI